ncbi:MAG: peptidylprolyl isomerase [Gemmatimonadota bacterium]|nr:peptidylprolyl isomerase [Gemmatimonadota bacterium]
MNFRSTAVLLTLISCAPAESGDDGNSQDGEPPAPPVTVILETTVGDITLELSPATAPETVANFLKYVRGGFYNGLTFHRIEPDMVIQSGAVQPNGERRVYPSAVPIANEAENGVKNLRGALGMARTTDPHSAMTEFFINLEDNPAFDFRETTIQGWGYAVFGHVVEGMDVVDRIGNSPTTRRGRYATFPVDPVVIERAYVQTNEDPE